MPTKLSAQAEMDIVLRARAKLLEIVKILQEAHSAGVVIQFNMLQAPIDPEDESKGKQYALTGFTATKILATLQDVTKQAEESRK
jgi:hypothetical protein